MVSTVGTMDLGAMEAEAKAKASKHVANLLQRPDQLEKVEQIRKRVARKKGSVEAMLKTAVQSQLDGVRTGLSQLQNALEDIREIKASLDEIDHSYRSIAGLGEELKEVREENSRHSQLAAAVENLKHIFNVPESVKKTEDFINDGKLLHAHKTLTELEMARDDLLFELHKQAQQSPTDRHTVNHYFAAVEKLGDSLAKQLWLILGRAIVSIRREPTIIVTVVRIIEREERMDAVMLKRKEQTSFMPPGRPRGWRAKGFQVLEEAVMSRVEGSQLEDRTTEKMWLVRHLEITRQLVLEDLRVVKTLFESCFPPYYDIVNKYVEMYHRSISQHLNDIVQQGLEGNEIVSLLTWVGAYNSTDLMGHPDLKINTSEIGPLLDQRQIMELQNQYIQTLRSNLREWMLNSLGTDFKDWNRSDTQPDADDKGFFNTSLPVILFQMIEQNLNVAVHISEPLTVNVINVCIDELDCFAIEYRKTLNEFRTAHLQNRFEPPYFIHYMIANINNCQTFSIFTDHIKKKYSNLEMDQDKFGNFNRVAVTFHNVAEDVCMWLVDEIFMDIDKYMSQLFTRLGWMGTTAAVDTILATIEDYSQDFVHLKDKYFDSIVNKCRDRVLVEYLKALFSRRIVFKQYEERVEAADKMKKEGEHMERFFSKLSNKANDDWPVDVIEKLAEVIKMKEASPEMMDLELQGLVGYHPSLQQNHLVNLLMMRGDIGRSESRQLVVNAMGDEEQARPVGWFSRIPNV